MKKTNQLTKRQHRFIDALISGKRDEQAILAEHNISRATYQKWLAEPAFLEQFELRIAMAYRHSRAVIAHHAHEAAERLVALTTAGTGETARKACLDIISMSSPSEPHLPLQPQDESAEPPARPPISPDTAARLLAVLAEEQNGAENER